MGGIAPRAVMRWSREDKARIIEETLAPGAKVSEVARRHRISASLVFTWRRQSRAHHVPPAVAPRSAAVRLAEASTEAAASTTSGQPRAAGGRSGLIEISLGGGRRVRVDAEGGQIRVQLHGTAAKACFANQQRWQMRSAPHDK
jgi:transposase